jgi:threonyl-tRNA synthetase
MQIEHLNCGSMGIGRCSASLLRMARRACSSSQTYNVTTASSRGIQASSSSSTVSSFSTSVPSKFSRSTSSFPSSHRQFIARQLTTSAATVDAAPTNTEQEEVIPGAGLTLADLPTSDQSENLLKIRHSCAHIMAMAVQKIHKGAQCTIGPWIERGFYYDFAMPTPIAEKDLPKIRKEMQKIIKRNLPFIKEQVSAAEARSRIEAQEEPYKLEILDSIVAKDPNAAITIYHIGTPGEKGSWWDLCAGPHVETTGAIDPAAIDLETVAGAYWRGDEANAQLQRLYGTAWETPDQLAAYKRLKEEAARRDHRKLGAELDLFSLTDSAGGGLVFWHPKGAMVRHVLETFWKEVHLKDGYNLLYTPHIAKLDLWKTSGHFDFYKESMFDQMQVENEEYQLRPMNCPFHVAIYKQGYYSYRDLPLRWAELGTVYRYERSGTMHGLFRVRGFTQDDAHIFCLPDQIAGEIRGVLDLIEELLSTFGFSEYEINLSTRPEKSVGSDEIWVKAENALIEALGAKGWDYTVDEGGGAFYGPKIDVKIKDALGRSWQCSTVQLDFNLPERFDMQYASAENTKERPIMIHRAILGSLERFMGVLIENYAGAFPMWLAPVQVHLVPVNDSVLPFVNEVAAKLRSVAGARVEVIHGMSVGKAIRNAETSKIPVMCVVGAREAEAGTLAVRTYRDGELGSLSVQEVVDRVGKGIHNRSDF